MKKIPEPQKLVDVLRTDTEIERSERITAMLEEIRQAHAWVATSLDRLAELERQSELMDEAVCAAADERDLAKERLNVALDRVALFANLTSEESL